MTLLKDTDTFQIVLSCFLIPIIIVSNILIIAAPLYCRRLRTPDNILMINLAVADLITGTVSMPINTLERIDDSLSVLMKESKEKCFIYHGLKKVPMALSLITLVMMCLDRYFAVKYPMKYVIKWSNNISIASILFIWVFVATIYGSGYSGFQYNSTIPMVKERCWYSENFTIWWQILNLVIISVSILTGGLTTCYLIVHIKGIQIRTKRQSIGLIHQEHKQGVKTNVYLLLIFTMLWLPAVVFGFISKSREDDEDLKTITYLISYQTTCINAAVNAAVYAFCRTRNRQAYRFMLRTPPWRWDQLEREMNKLEFRSSVGFSSSMSHSQRHTRVFNSPLSSI